MFEPRRRSTLDLQREWKKMNNDLIGNSNNKKPKKRRPLWKWSILVIFILIISVLSWVGFAGWNALKHMTSNGNGSFWSLLKNPHAQELQGEQNGRVNILLIGIGGKNHQG